MKMRLGIFCAFIGYLLHSSVAANQDKNVHIKIHVPELTHKHNHQHTIIKETPTARYEITISDPIGDRKEHNHDFNPENEYTHKEKYAYNPEKKHKTKHKKAGKDKPKKLTKKYVDEQEFKRVLENYNEKPEENDDGGFKTSVHTEHYEVKKINPNARYPDEKYIIEGAYKVQETDPWGQPVTSFEKYDSPISKIAASIITNYDYTNFRPGETDSFGKEKDRDPEKSEYAADDEGYDNYDNKKRSQNYNSPSSQGHKLQYSNYEAYETPNAKDNDKNYENSGGYEIFVNEKKAYQAAPKKPSHQSLHAYQRPQGYTGPQGYGTFKPDDSKRVENVKKRPADVVFIVPQDNDGVHKELEYEFEKEFGHLVQPGHTGGSSESNYDYDSDWQKHIIDYLYGGEHAASDKFVRRVKPENVRGD